MIDRLIDFSTRNPLLILLLTGLFVLGGIWAIFSIALDALPDLSDTQVIVFSRWERSPDIIEDQVTYPIVTALLGAPRVKAVRGYSDFGYSFVYVIFEDGTDIYWARSRTLEYLSAVLPRLPDGVRTEPGPDASGVGWVFQYVLADSSGKHDLAQLRSIQDWFIRYHLQSVPGVAEVAPIGGFVRQYQINLDPLRLKAFNLSIDQVLQAVRANNRDVGARLVELAGAEYMVRGRGYANSVQHLENIVLATTSNGTPVLVGDVGKVTVGPEIRRGLLDWNGQGETVGGILVMRHGENALRVIQQIKSKIREIEPGLPQGVKILTAYDRSELILRSVDTLRSTLRQELLIVSLIILIFLLHPASALIPIVTIPTAILISFLPMKAMGLTANIMSLGGIAIAIGALVDASIVVVEQTHKKLEEWEKSGRQKPYREAVVDAVKEVGSPSFFALLVIAVSFAPVLALQAQEGRLFRPLAWTKNLAMLVAAVLAITLDPALRILLTHTEAFAFRPWWLARAASLVLAAPVWPEEKHLLSRTLIRLYKPACSWALRHKYLIVGSALLLMFTTVPVYLRLGSEFMPPLDEGTLLFMPTTLPGISVTEVARLIQVQNQVLMSFPEVATVMGKAGRADTATDPAPLSMMETVIVLKPKDQWRKHNTWYSDWAPGWLKPLLAHITPEQISTDQLIQELDQALQLPGVSNAWTMPIKARIDMLSTGIRTPVGIKISGSDPQQIERIGLQLEGLLHTVPGTRSVFAERFGGGYFLDVEWNRELLARYGLSMDEVQTVLASAVGGENLTTTVEGRQRFPVNARYFRDFRQDVDKLERVLIPVNGGQVQIPLSYLARIVVRSGPSMLRNENGLLAGYVYVDVAGRDLGGYVQEARRIVRQQVSLPPGYSIAWSGHYEALQRFRARLLLVVPVTLSIIIVLLYLNTRSAVETLIVLLAVPFSAIGAFWLLYLLDYDLSVGVWVGLIALLGVDAETGVFMLVYLNLAYRKAKAENRLNNLPQLQQAILEGAVLRIRPKFMTVACTFLALLPIMWSTGTGSEVMKRIAAPMVGGIFTSFVLELLVYPVIFEIWKWHSEVKKLSLQR